jgi:endonuclease I
MRSVYIFLFCLLLPFWADAQNPNGYYNTASGKKKEALKTALHYIVRDHTVIDYGSMWNAFYATDRKTDGSVWDMYSSNVRYFANTSGMNREHSLPKSWWGGDVNAAYTDLNHLFPSDADANTAKLNYPLGVVGSTTFNNGTSKVGANAYPGYSGPVYEPANQYKGDFARAYLYMVTCYQDYYNKWKYFYMLDGNTYPVLKPWAINMLLEWHRNDPVSSKEINRNEAVFKIQNNRNPFIDYPELAEYIWGTKTEETFIIDTNITGTVLVTPTNDTQLAFGTVLKGNSVTKTLYVKGINLTGKSLTATLFGADAAMFKINTTSIPTSTANSSSGYALTVTYTPTQTANTHNAAIIIYDGGINGSVQVNITGKCIDPLLVKPPVASEATSITQNSFTANWMPVSNADSYILELFNESSSPAELIMQQEDIALTSYTIGSIEANTNYSYWVKSVFGDVISSPSNKIVVSTPLSLQNTNNGNGIKMGSHSRTIWVTAQNGQLNYISVFTANGQMIANRYIGGPKASIPVPFAGIYVVDVDGLRDKVNVR